MSVQNITFTVKGSTVSEVSMSIPTSMRQSCRQSKQASARWSKWVATPCTSITYMTTPVTRVRKAVASPNTCSHAQHVLNRAAMSTLHLHVIHVSCVYI